ncbi:MAG: MMPL family transporter, partial [Bacteroidales bacterium]|nr:MMPL family transporter [Bacteroidales bacterium]
MKKELFIFRYKTLLISTPIILAVISLILLLRIKVNSDLNAYFPETLSSKINQKKIEAIFGKDEMMMIVLEADDVLNPETLKRIEAIDDTLEASNSFSDVMSLFGTKNIRGEEGMMLVDPAIPEIPSNKEETEALRKSLKENELAYKLFVSDDFKYALFIITVKEGIDDKEAVRNAQHAITINEGPEQAHLFGLPYLRVESNEKITRDFLILLPIGLILMISFLFISFREKRGVWLPMLVVVLSTLVSLALLPVMGWDLSLVGIIIPIMMIAIANNYGVHIIARYQEVLARHPEFTKKEIILEVYNKLKAPIILTGLTTIVGILGLVAHTMIPASQMGVISGLGVGFALWMSLSFIPAILSIMKKGKVHKSFSSEKSIE